MQCLNGFEDHMATFSDHGPWHYGLNSQESAREELSDAVC